jgi:hypothetical protein
MYFAWATIEDDDHHGSTKLHMDLTDAMNKMLWGANGSDGQPGPALWHLFDAVDAPVVRKFLKEDCDFQGPGDAVHSQTVYLTPDKRKLLFEKYRVRPYTIYQYPNQAVFIPAYCIHQVSYYIDVQVPLGSDS